MTNIPHNSIISFCSQTSDLFNTLFGVLQAISERARTPELPTIIEEDPERWLGLQEPQKATVEKLLQELKDHFGEVGYLWLQACAFSPLIHWKITLHLGHNLCIQEPFAPEPHPLFCEKMLSVFVRLPWFRYGYMPDWLRYHLTKELSQLQQRKIHNLLQQVAPLGPLFLGTRDINNPIDFIDKLKFPQTELLDYIAQLLPSNTQRIISKLSPKEIFSTKSVTVAEGEITVSITQIFAEQKVFLPNNAQIQRRQRKHYSGIVEQISRPTGWPTELWKECWNEEAGFIDFTVDNWVQLPHSEQFRLAQSYQHWYAKEKKLVLTRTIEKNGVEFVFKLIPPGKFWMGSPEDEPSRFERETQHKVIISQPYWLGETEVTQRQWQAITGNNPAHFQESGLDAPVENISWEDCEKYSKEQGWQMPTEAQWEYACRGGTTRVYSFGEWDKNKLNSASYWAKQDLMSYEQWGEFGFLDKWQELGAKTLPVKNFVANSFGLYDMHGNVWEWCQDRHGEYPKEEVKDPLGAKEGSQFVIRGGCWGNPAADCRSAFRDGGYPDFSNVNLGVRFSLSSRSGK